MAYLDVLCSVLSSLRYFKLENLDDEDDLQLPKVRGKGVQQAVSDIRNSLTSQHSHFESLQSVAHLYCFLVGQRAVQPWVLYRLDQGGNQADRVAGIVNNVQRRSEVGIYAKTTPSFASACLVTPDEVGCMDYIPHIFCTWPDLPCVAVHQPPPGYSTLGTGVLRQMVGGPPDSFYSGVYQDLNEAFRAAGRLTS